jgi:hypothetical protein
MLEGEPVKKRINSTGRRKLFGDDVRITIIQENSGGPASFEAKFDFSELPDLDRNAKVYVEPYVRSSSMRFDFGVVANPVSPATTVMTDLDRGESVLFRVRVVDDSQIVGRILAAANGIRPIEKGDSSDRKPLLPLKTTDTGELLWRLAFDPSSGPVLEISNKVPALASRIKIDPLLQGSIYPMALRDVLTRLTSESVDEEAEWFQDWSKFVSALTGSELDELENDEVSQEMFISDAVTTFADAHRFASKAAEFSEVSE